MQTEHHVNSSTTMPTTDQSPSMRLLDRILGCPLNQAIYVGARLGLADLLADGPKGHTQLAQATGTHAPSLYRVLRTLASADVLDERPDGSFSLTEIGECLRSGAPGSLRAYATMHGSPAVRRMWDGFFLSVSTGETAFDHVYGVPVFRYLQDNPDLRDLFHEAMVERTEIEAAAILEAYDFSEMATLVDVGGGRGSLLAAILHEYPGARGILLDVPAAISEPHPLLTTPGVRERCELVGGDFFASLPPGADAYLLKSIVHSWDDDHAMTILRNCRRAMSTTTKLLLIEMVIPPDKVPPLVALHDLMMLAAAGGKERDQAEFAGLLHSAGFDLGRIVQTRALVSVIEARPSG